MAKIRAAEQQSTRVCHGVVSWLCHMPSVCYWAWVALPSIAACLALQKRKPHRPIDPIRARLNGCSAPPRGVGRGRITRQHHGYPAPHPDFFIATKLKFVDATVTERPKQALGFSVACNANFLTKRPKTGYRFTVMYDANYLTKRLETGYRFSVPSDANSFTERSDSGGARQHHSPMQDR